MTAPRFIGLAVLLAIAATTQVCAQSGPNIPFAPIEDTALKDPDYPAKKFRIDFARVEQEFPLTRQHLMSITPQNIVNLSQEQIDQIYGRLAAGPIPDGPHAGNLFFARGDRISAQADLHTRLQQILGGLEGRIAGAGIETLEDLGRRLWKGKVFYRDQRVLRNMIENTAVIQALTDDRSSVMTLALPRQGPLAKLFRNNKVWLLFPAKLYCGQSLVDARREAIIVDYNYSDEIEGYRASPDSLAGRGGLRIRDEVRMIRPGFYLGRAYTNRMFLLNFTLYNAEVANRDGPAFATGKAVAEDCWPGEQARKTVAR